MDKTKFNWKCIHCEKRNITPLNFQFDVPQGYSVEWACRHCGKNTTISWTLNIAYPKKQK